MREPTPIIKWSQVQILLWELAEEPTSTLMKGLIWNGSYSGEVTNVKNIQTIEGRAIVGYDSRRMELSSSLSAKWRPTSRLGVSAVLREELFGRDFSPLIPALFIDGVISQRGNVLAKASVSRN